MYRRNKAGQQKLEIPFGIELDAENRWVRLAKLMPWDKIEEKYAQNFKDRRGQIAKVGRLAFGALYIQKRLRLTDVETADQIGENPSMQYFCGMDSYKPQRPFDASLMVHFRKRISAEMIKEISEEIFTAEAKKALEREKKDDAGGGGGDAGGGGDDTGGGQGDNATQEPKGTLLLDATCCPSDIEAPTDIGLLNHARELTEGMIDTLHQDAHPSGEAKPRTYREAARKAYLNFTKNRRYTYEQLRMAIGEQLQYVKRNLETIAAQVKGGARLEALSKEQYRKLLVISELYRQQKLMYDEKTHKVEGRIVSIAQPHLRPIVRGKTRTPVEFGAKVATAHIGGFSFVIHMDFENFSEAKYLAQSAEEYKRLFGFYPKVIIGDKAYAINENRDYCKARGIRLSAPKRGRKSEEAKREEQEQLYRDSGKRNAIEGDYGTCKRKYGLNLIMTKLRNTTLTSISLAFFVKNMERILRLFVFHFYLLFTYFNPLLFPFCSVPLCSVSFSKP